MVLAHRLMSIDICMMFQAIEGTRFCEGNKQLWF